MRLGNSQGKNRGKKYFIRGKHDIDPPHPENMIKAARFTEWFELNFVGLTNFLKGKQSYDDDVFNTTFLNITEKILYSGCVVKDYKAYFSRAYYTNYIQSKVKESRYCQLANFEYCETSRLNQEELERLQNILESDIFDYVYRQYNVREFELFKMYINLKPAVNYEILSGITHVKTHVIQRIISKILCDIRRNKVFVRRYYELNHAG